MIDSTTRSTEEWWAEIDAIKAQISAKSSTPWWVPDTRTGIVYWMSISSFTILVLLWYKPPTGDTTLLNTLLGMYIGTGLIGSINWWMGSNKGSEAKTDALVANQKDTK
jgi:hypothetical protein